ncbi:MAG: thiol-disulfide oxidoreductase DCC family protein [Vicinamibacterales bacterium]
MFYDFDGVRRSVTGWLRGSGRSVRVFYDGRCGLCGRTVRALRGLDLLDRLDLVDFRRLPDEGPASPDAQGVSRDALESEMAVVDTRGQVHWGFDGYRALMWHVPIGWPMLLLVYLPGVPRLGRTIYGYVAARRAGICELRPDGPTPELPAPVAHRRGAAGTLAIGLFLMSWWVTHVEFFPFTTLKMFSTINPRVISYVRPIAVLADGRREPARFERWIGAMADSRYREVVLAPFRGGDRRRCDEFLAATVHAANLRRQGPPVVGVDLQFWQWDFAADPDNPSQGQVVSTYEYRVSRH